MSRKKEALILKNLDGLNSTEANILFDAVKEAGSNHLSGRRR